MGDSLTNRQLEDGPKQCIGPHTCILIKIRYTGIKICRSTRRHQKTVKPSVILRERRLAALEWLVSGNVAAKLLDFFVTYRDFDYSETDIANSSGVSKRTVFREIPKMESVGLVKFTRNVGRAKMFKLNPESKATKLLEQFAFEIADKRIENALADEMMQGLT